MKKVSNNNKGFTLVELVVAIAILAIILTPLLQSFVTSAKLNKRSREMMAATNITQSLMEGISDKTFTECLNIATTKMGSELSGKYEFSTINSNAFNKSENFLPATTLNAMKSCDVGNISCNKISWAENGVTYTDVSANGVYYSGSDSAACHSAMVDSHRGYLSSIGNAYKGICPDRTPRITYFTDKNKQMLSLFYWNIEEGGLYYDALIIMTPAAENATDTYYPYYVSIYVFEVQKNKQDDGTDFHKVDVPVMTYTSGIKNICKKGNIEK